MHWDIVHLGGEAALKNEGAELQFAVPSARSPSAHTLDVRGRDGRGLCRTLN